MEKNTGQVKDEVTYLMFKCPGDCRHGRFLVVPTKVLHGAGQAVPLRPRLVCDPRVKKHEFTLTLPQVFTGHKNKQPLDEIVHPLQSNIEGAKPLDEKFPRVYTTFKAIRTTRSRGCSSWVFRFCFWTKGCSRKGTRAHCISRNKSLKTTR